mmetsp:Transcript_6868/g.24433  ORF Transcript_6868/g.24433 Transcript_6868/m.24433 type:complete len:123 (+) Transcript_6868:960-1328(+)
MRRLAGAQPYAGAIADGAPGDGGATGIVWTASRFVRELSVALGARRYLQVGCNHGVYGAARAEVKVGVGPGDCGRHGRSLEDATRAAGDAPFDLVVLVQPDHERLLVLADAALDHIASPRGI